MYAPQIAKILAYADCTIILLTNTDPRFCDCNRIIDVEAIPVGEDRPNKQKELSLKADWKYLGETVYNFSESLSMINHPKNGKYFSWNPLAYAGAIFHPPQLDILYC